MQADYLLNLTFPHPNPPKAATKAASRELLFSLMRLPHLAAFPFWEKTADKQATLFSPQLQRLSGWQAHEHFSYHSLGDTSIARPVTSMPKKPTPVIGRRQTLARVSAMLSKVPPTQPAPACYLCSWSRVVPITEATRQKKFYLFSAQLCPELKKPRCGLSQSSLKQEAEVELPAKLEIDKKW